MCQTTNQCYAAFYIVLQAFFNRNSNRFEATRWVSWTRWRRRAARLSPWHRRKAAAALATSRRDSEGRQRGQVMIQLWLKPMDWSTGKIYTSTIKYKGFLQSVP
jgi:hypothetical protein